MRENVESGIRFKAVLIYLVVAAVCAGMIVYVYNMRENIGLQREHIEQYYQTLNLTNELVFTVNEAQSEANLYVATRSASHLTRFRKKSIKVEQMIDSLQALSGSNVKDTLLIQVNQLLNEKGRIVSGLSREFAQANPMDTISRQLQALDSLLIDDPVVVTTTVKDTLMKTLPEKGFWDRVATVFSPGRSIDTIVTVQTRIVDSMRLSRQDKANLLYDMSVIAELARIDYASRITAIELQVGLLMRTDQQISAQLSSLLNALSRQAMTSTIDNIRKSEQLIRGNYTFSVVGGSVALALILLFILLIIGDVNRGKTARRALRQIMDTRHQLFLSVSHDIKTPLNSISGNIELWKKDSLVPDEQARSVEHSTAHILALMNNLLEFSNLEQGTQAVSDSDFNLYELCREVGLMFEPLARRKQLAIEYDFQMDQRLMVRGDVLKIKQVVINILSNAVKYTTEGSIRFHANYLPADGQKLAYFRITDTGAGIPADQMGNLFKPFSRVKKNNELATGSGLGMYVVKGITELLGGGVYVQSTEGTGTTVEVSLPVTDAKGEPGWKQVRDIVVVDDDPALLAVLRGLFAQLGYTVRLCNRPEEVMSLLRASKADLVITDMEMGKTTGKDVLQWVRTHGKDMRVVVMTGRGDYQAVHATADGFDGYLSKPVSRAMLSQLLGVKAATSSTFESLEELFGGDKEAIADILLIFAASTQDNLARLYGAYAIDDFAEVQAVCHKMLPMFEQVGVTSCLDTLRWMDSLRRQSASDHPDWRERIVVLIHEVEETLEEIRRQYPV